MLWPLVMAERLLAQTAPTDFPTLATQLGIGAVIAAWPSFVWRQEKARADRAEMRNEAMTTVMIEQFTPAMVRTQEAMKANADALSAALSTLKQAADAAPDSSQMAELLRLLHRLDTRN